MADSNPESAVRWTAPSYTSDCDVEAGINKLHSYLRSIVITPNVFELFVGFNRQQLSADGLWKSLVRQKKKPTDFCGTKKGMHKGLLAGPARAKGSSSERHFTDEMARQLQQFEHLNTMTTITASSADEAHADNSDETPEASEPGGKQPDLEITIGLKDRLLACVQVGLTKNECEGEENQARIDNELDRLFWQKVNQAIHYLDIVHTAGVKDKTKKIRGQPREIHASGTLLLCLLVLDRGRKRGRLAVFACEPSGKSRRARRRGRDPSFRMALLWRRKATIDQLDIDYGRFIKAVFMLGSWGCDPSKSSMWKYLGPNCSKVTIDGKSYVLRAYDTRVRATSRSPYLYNTMCKNDTKLVLSIEDGGDGQILPFGEEASSDGFPMLFCDPTINKRGKVEVIAVPFLEGSHICTHVDQAIAVLEMLQKMHKENLVHGDIRGFNIVFADEPAKSALIDFDFGGKVGKAKYPARYVVALPDGARRGRCEGGALIEKQDDVYAIFNVLFSKHTLPNQPPPVRSEIQGAYLNFFLTKPTTVKDLLAGVTRLKHAGVLEMEAREGYREHLEAANPGDKGLNTPLVAQQSPPALVQNNKLRSNEGEGSKEATRGRLKIGPNEKKRGRAKEVASGSGKGAKSRKRSK